MIKYFKIILVIILLINIFGCSETNSDEYFQIFQKEMNYYKNSNRKYYFEKRDEVFVERYLGIFTKNLLVFREYCLLDSNKNILLRLHLWREGALKENHGDVLTITRMDYQTIHKDSMNIKVINCENSYSIWGPKHKLKIIETRNSKNFLIKKTVIDQSYPDTTISDYNFNKNKFINYIINNKLTGKIIKIAFNGKVVVEQINDGRTIHILGNIKLTDLSEYLNDWTTVDYYDANYKILEEKDIEYGKVLRDDKYNYVKKDNKEITEVYQEDVLVRKIIKSIVAL